MDAISIHAVFLFSLLGHPDYSVRDKVIVPYHFAVLGVRHPDLEIRYRCWSSYKTRQREAVQELIAGNRPLPYIDSLPLNHPDRWQVVYGHLNDVGAYPDPCWQRESPYGSYRLATEIYLLTLTAEEARIVLGSMRRGGWYCGLEWIKGPP